jgi:putative transposase
MVQYRRNYIEGGTYFFTVALRDRKAATLVERIEELREAVRSVKREKAFRIDAWVVLPDHLHAIWSLPRGDADFSGRWRAIKARFTRAVIRAGVAAQGNNTGEYNLWQRRFWEHTIRDERDYARHVDYIHYNPVKHRLVNQARDWPHSTFHRYVSMAVYSKDWGERVLEVDGHD